MWFTRLSSGFRGWFSVVKTDGTLRENLLEDDFVVTVRDPTDMTGSTFPVTQSGKQGLYRFDITSSFISSSGAGEYGVVVEINTYSGSSGAPNIRSAFSQVMRVTQEDFDTLVDSIWDEPNSDHRISGSVGDSIYSGSLAQVGDISVTASVNVAAVASGVWDAGSSGFSVPGSMGDLINKIGPMSSSVEQINQSTIELSSSVAQVHQTTLELSSSVGHISGCIDFIKDIEGGRWRIDTGSNQMIFYKSDNTTEVARFDLFDSTGSPTFENPFERRRT